MRSWMAAAWFTFIIYVSIPLHISVPSTITYLPGRRYFSDLTGEKISIARLKQDCQNVTNVDLYKNHPRKLNLRCRGGTEDVSLERITMNNTGAESDRSGNGTFQDYVWSREFSRKSDPLFMMGLNESEKEAARDEYVKQIMSGDEDVEQLVESLKDQGNAAMLAAEKLKLEGNKNFTALYRQAIRHYSQALSRPFTNVSMRVLCLANRAAAHLARSNLGHVIRDCNAAETVYLNISVSNNGSDAASLIGIMEKCYRRAAKACLFLENFDQARSYCNKAAALNRSCNWISDILLAADTCSRRLAAAADKRARELDAHRQHLFTVKDVVSKRGIIIGGALYPEILDMQLVDVNAENDGRMVLWPMLFIYDEHGQSDFLRQCSEDSTIAQQLNEVFGPGTPPPAWDPHRTYTPASVSIYYISFQAPVMFQGRLQWPRDPATGQPCRKRWVKVETRERLVDVLRMEGHVVPRFPVLHVTRAGSAHERHMLSLPCEEVLPPDRFAAE